MRKIVGPIFTLVVAVAATVTEARAEDVKLPVAILHADTFTDVCTGKIPITSDALQMSLDKMKEGGVALVGAAIWITNKVAEPAAALEHVRRTAECIKKTVGAHPKELMLALSSGEARYAGAHGKIAVVITVEGGEPALAGPGALKEMHAWGVRAMSLTWSRDDGLASAHNTKDDKGLSAAGGEAVAGMNRLGMMVDVSHASDRTVDDILAASKRPVFASHANARALAKVNRNLTDERIRRICQGGGVVGVNFHVAHLTSMGAAGAKDVAAHARWIGKLGGEACAAIGGDLDGRIKLPAGLEDAAKLQGLVPALRDEGISPGGVGGALFGNFVEFWKRVEADEKPADREAK